MVIVKHWLIHTFTNFQSVHHWTVEIQSLSPNNQLCYYNFIHVCFWFFFSIIQLFDNKRMHIGLLEHFKIRCFNLCVKTIHDSLFLYLCIHCRWCVNVSSIFIVLFCCVVCAVCVFFTINMVIKCIFWHHMRLTKLTRRANNFQLQTICNDMILDVCVFVCIDMLLMEIDFCSLHMNVCSSSSCCFCFIDLVCRLPLSSMSITFSFA